MRGRTLAGLTVALIGVLAALAAEVFPPSRHTVTAQQSDIIIEVRADGFNPAECTLNRNARRPIRFLNVDDKPRRIVVDELYAPEPGGFARDTGWLEPGELSPGWTFGEIQDLTYRDHDNPGLTGKIIVPLSNTAQTICDIEDEPAGPSGSLCGRVISNPQGCGIVPRVGTDGPLE